MAVRAQQDDEYEDEVDETKEEEVRVLKKKKSQVGPWKKKIVPLG